MFKVPNEVNFTCRASLTTIPVGNRIDKRTGKIFKRNESGYGFQNVVLCMFLIS